MNHWTPKRFSYQRRSLAVSATSHLRCDTMSAICDRSDAAERKSVRNEQFAVFVPFHIAFRSLYYEYVVPHDRMLLKDCFMGKWPR